jgi:D-sedoheptulose 7-phosphate isomerase
MVKKTRRGDVVMAGLESLPERGRRPFAARQKDNTAAPWPEPQLDGEFSARPLTLQYVAAMQRLLGEIDAEAVDRVVARLREARDSGGTIFIAGNGGSASTASHWANDLGKATKLSGRAPVRVMCLADNMSWLTALANDEGYDRAFAGQIENFAQEGDVLAVISASGNSANLLHAVDVAQEQGAATVGLLAFDGGALRSRLDDYVWLPTEKGAYELAEDSHAVLCHIMTLCLAHDRAPLTA